MSKFDWVSLERALGVRFNDRSLLSQAVVHRSFVNEYPQQSVESYDRLEYLGDAFLGWVVADELYRRYPGHAEGALTRGRAALVQGTNLAGIARCINLGNYLRLGLGEESSGGRQRGSNLAAALEAVLGAVLLDSGPLAARALVLRWLGEQMGQLGEQGAPLDPKSALQELAQGRGLPLPEYVVLNESGPPHARHYIVQVLLDGTLMGEGSGKRKVEAEKTAALHALHALLHTQQE